MSEVNTMMFSASEPHSAAGNSGDVDRESQKRLSVDIPASLHKAVKIRCADEERDIRDVVIEKLTEYVNSVGKRRK